MKRLAPVVVFLKSAVTDAIKRVTVLSSFTKTIPNKKFDRVRPWV